MVAPIVDEETGFYLIWCPTPFPSCTYFAVAAEEVFEAAQRLRYLLAARVEETSSIDQTSVKAALRSQLGEPQLHPDFF